MTEFGWHVFATTLSYVIAPVMMGFWHTRSGRTWWSDYSKRAKTSVPLWTWALLWVGVAACYSVLGSVAWREGHWTLYIGAWFTVIASVAWLPVKWLSADAPYVWVPAVATLLSVVTTVVAAEKLGIVYGLVGGLPISIFNAAAFMVILWHSK